MLDWLFGKRKQSQKKESTGKKKSKQEIDKEDKWKYDLLVQFLSSPVWRVSILDFVDSRCLIFDNEQENKFQYTTIHNQFKQMVATLFDGMMEEVGLTDQKLAELIEKGFQSKDKKVFAQLLLCDDFLKFKNMMVKRNRALQQQAVKALQGSQNNDLPPQQLQRKIIKMSQRQQAEKRRKIELQQQRQLQEALRLSKLQAETQAISKLESSAIKFQNSQTHQNFQQNPPKIPVEQQQQQQSLDHQTAQHQDRKQRLRKLRKNKLDSLKEEKQALPPIKQHKYQGPQWDLQPLNLPKQQQQQHIQSKKQQQKIQPVQQISQAETVQKKQEPLQEVQTQQSRKKRLMEQRQKIRKKKQQERKKMLQQEGNKKTVNIVLQDDGIHDTHAGIPVQEQEKVSMEEIKRRKQLMKKIKNRIVEDI